MKQQKNITRKFLILTSLAGMAISAFCGLSHPANAAVVMIPVAGNGLEDSILTPPDDPQGPDTLQANTTLSGPDSLKVTSIPILTGMMPPDCPVTLPVPLRDSLLEMKAPEQKPEWRRRAEALQQKAGTGDPRDYPKILDAIEEVSEKKGFPPEILCGIIHRETRWDNKIGDRGNGFGVMQVDKRWHAKWLRENNWRDIPANIEYSLSEIEGYYDSHGNISRALASYNAGPGRVARAIKAGLSPDTPTTGKNYSKDVLQTARELGWDGQVRQH